MVEVAIFPIPKLVAFPGQLIPLHVFEPRYRKMIADCLEEDRLLGVACASECIAERHLENCTLEEKLNANHDTYRVHDVFSAGKVRIDETLEDGRLIVTVAASHRFKISNFLQSVPYYLCEAEEIPADLSNARAIDIEFKRLRRLTAALLTGKTREVFEELDEKLGHRPEELLGVYMQLIQIDSHLQQEILEIDDLEWRIRKFADSIEVFLIRSGIILPSARNPFRNQTPEIAGENSDLGEPAPVIPLFGDAPSKSE